MLLDSSKIRFFMTSDSTQFEITKHYAAVCRAYFKWIMCYTPSDGSSITYAEVGDSKSKKMSADQVRSLGERIERREAVEIDDQ